MTAPDRQFLELQAALKGRYSLDRELGRGGMGVVYLAHEVALDRPVALKVLPSEVAGDTPLRERFLREARTAARLSHPHIVPIFSVDEVDGFVFFAMAYIDGETLGERVRARGPLGHAEAARVLKEVAWALAYAHAQGLVHRDVKPDNILLEAGTGRALVTDFGIALPTREAAGGDGDRVVGTAEFMSPEQARGGEIDARSDIWSLGAVGFYAVSGRLPFEGGSAAAVLGAIVSRPAPAVATVAPDLPSRLAGPIDRCLRADPALRFPGGEAVAEALAQQSTADRPLPVPLRVFIKRIRELSRSVPGAILVIFLFSSGIIARLMVEVGAWAGLAILTALAGGSLAVVGTIVAFQARKLLKAGYRVEDVRHALAQDVERRNEELAFEYGVGYTWYDRLLKGVTIGGFSLGVVSLGGYLLLAQGALGAVAGFSTLSGGLAGLLALGRERLRRDVVGGRWLKLLRTPVGKGVFDLGGLWLRRPAALGSATYRPTELAIGLAADRLFEDLPKDVRRSLGGLPAAVRELEADAQEMRRHVAELDEVIAEIGDDPERAGADERARVRADVVATRDEARARLTEAVSALETIRLGLLRMHAGDGTIEGITRELEAARAISGDMDALLAGRLEVERLLSERRHGRTGTFRPPDPERPVPETDTPTGGGP